jgi:hypothetical protein
LLSVLDDIKRSKIYSPEKFSFREETRPFNVVADDPNGVTCLVLDRQSYHEMIADELSRLKREESFKYARKKYVRLIGKMEFSTEGGIYLERHLLLVKVNEI